MGMILITYIINVFMCFFIGKVNVEHIRVQHVSSNTICVLEKISEGCAIRDKIGANVVLLDGTLPCGIRNDQIHPLVFGCSFRLHCSMQSLWAKTMVKDM